MQLNYKFQEDAVNLIWNDFRTEQSSLCIVPTGGGKTKIAIDIIRKIRQASQKTGKIAKILIIVPLSPLIAQFKESILKFGGTELYLKTGILAGSRSTSEKKLVECEVIIAMAQTFESRKKLPWYPSVIIWDECHLSCFRDAYLLAQALVPKAKNLKLTATPWRMDGQSFDEKIWHHPTDTEELIQDGYLVPYKIVSLGDFNLVLKSDKDYTTAQAEKITSVASPRKVWEEWQEKYGHLHTIGFVPSHEVGYQYAEYFCSQGQEALLITDEMPETERQTAYRRFREERIVLFSVTVLATGFDQPLATCALMLRPTKSLALWLQMLGRILRTVKNDDNKYIKSGLKDCAYILDFCGNSKLMPLPHEIKDWKKIDLMRGKKCKQCNYLNPKLAEECEECGYVFSQSGGGAGGASVVSDINLSDAPLPNNYWELINNYIDNRQMIEISVVNLHEPKNFYRYCLKKCFINNHLPKAAYFQFQDKFKMSPLPEWQVNAIFDGICNIQNLVLYIFYLNELKQRKGKKLDWLRQALITEFGTQYIMDNSNLVETALDKIVNGYKTEATKS